MKKIEWEKTFFGNEILEGNGFYVSYRNEVRDLDFAKLGSLLDIKTGEAGETALFTREDNKWRILNGDFRKEYDSLVPKGLDACVEFYNKNRDKRSDWSTDEENV